MRKMVLAIKCQLLYFLRNRKNVIALLLCWVYCSAIFILYMPDEDPLAMVQDSFYGQALTMLLFLFYGMHLWQLEQSVPMAEWSKTVAVSPALYLAAKMFVLFIVSFAFSSLIAFSNVLAFSYMKMPPQVMAYACKMIGINYLLPAFDCALLGMIIGNLTTSRAKYAVLMAAWLVTSPFSLELSEYIMSLIGYDVQPLTYAFAILNPGSRMQTGATPMYGIPFDPYRCAVGGIRTFLLLCWLVVMCVPAVRHARMRLWKFLVSAGMLTIVTIAVMLSYSIDSYKAVIYAGIPESRRAGYDSSYYYTEIYNRGSNLAEDALPSFDGKRYLTVEREEISLQIDYLTMSVDCEMTAIASETISQQSFTLYRDLIIDTVLLNGEAQTFEQCGDYVRVTFSKPVRAGEKVRLSFAYTGSPSPIFTANASAVYLNANFPWIPECGMRRPLEYSPYSQTDLLTLYARPQDASPVMYTLNFASPYITYVNLDQVSPGVWEGMSVDGVSIYADALMVCTHTDDFTVYYPASVEPKLEQILSISGHSANALTSVEQALGIGSAEECNTAVLLPVAPTLEQIGVIRNYRMHGDMMLYFESGYFLKGYMRRYSEESMNSYPGSSEVAALQDAVWAVTNTPACLRSFTEEPANQLWITCFIKWYCANNDLPDISNTQWGKFETLQKVIARTYDDGEDAHLAALNQLIEQLERKLSVGKQTLPNWMKQWYAGIREGKTFTVDEILAMTEGE